MLMVCNSFQGIYLQVMFKKGNGKIEVVIKDKDCKVGKKCRKVGLIQLNDQREKVGGQRE